MGQRSPIGETGRIRWLAGAWGALLACAVDDRAVDVAGGAPAITATGGTSAAGGDAGGSSGGGSSGGGSSGTPGGTAGLGGNAPDGSERDGGAGEEGSSVCSGASDCDGGTPAPSSGCAVDIASSVPFMANWSSVGRPDLYDGGCDSLGTPEYALVFTAPEAATFRITSVALVDTVPYTGAGTASGVPDGPADGDSVMTVVRGNCAGVAAQQLECNDDVAPGTLDSGLDLALDAGEVVTVYLNELTQTGGGSGTVNITALP
jgi:hypothetical protein